jgi:hypothetical protein
MLPPTATELCSLPPLLLLLLPRRQMPVLFLLLLQLLRPKVWLLRLSHSTGRWLLAIPAHVSASRGTNRAAALPPLLPVHGCITDRLLPVLLVTCSSRMQGRLLLLLLEELPRTMLCCISWRGLLLLLLLGLHLLQVLL